MNRETQKPEDIIGKPLVYWLAGATTKRVAETDPQAEQPDIRKTREVSMVFSTDTPIRHWFGYVVLDHSKDAMMLDRLNSNGPYLRNHNWDAKLGKVLQAATDGHQGTATAKITRNPIGEEFINDFEDGLETGVSVGFFIHKMVLEEETDNEVTYRATEWEPIEISDAFIPADVGCNYIRELTGASAARFPELPPIEANSTANNSPAETETRSAENPPVQPPAEPQPLTEVRTVKSMDQTQEQKILAYGQMMDEVEMARDFIAAEKTEAEFRTAVQEKRQKASPQLDNGPVVDLNPKERQRYSVARAILADANIRAGKKDSCFELEVSEDARTALASRAPNYKNMGGVVIPTGVALRGSEAALTAQRRGFDNLGAMAFRSMAREQQMLNLLQRAGLDTLTDTSGQELVFTEQGTFIDLLRNKAMVIQLGATVLPGLVGNVAFPKQIGAGTFSWVAENSGSDTSESNLTLDQVTLSPKTGQTTTSYSRQLLAQSNVNVDGLVLADIALITGLGIDRAALHGLGSSNQPKGLYAQSGVNGVAFGGAITFAKVVECESSISAANADIGTMAYLTTPEIRGKAKTTQRFSSTDGQGIWHNGEMNGYRAEATNQLSKVMNASAVSGGSGHGFIFGVWSELLIGEWGALEIVTDPYRLKKQGMIEVTGFVMVDETVRYGEAFSKGTGLTNT